MSPRTRRCSRDRGNHTVVETSVQEVSMDEVEPGPPQSEPRVQDLVLEAQHRVSFQATLSCFLGRGSRPQPQDNTWRLEYVANTMLHDWYQPERNSIWSERMVFSKLNNLKLVPEQQAILDTWLRLDQ